MALTVRQRRALLIAAGGTAFAVAYALTPRDDSGVEPAPAAQRVVPAAIGAARETKSTAGPALGQPQRTAIALHSAGDPFASRSFLPPPPPAPPPPKVVPPPPPPPPTAPPLPFTYVGLLEQGSPRPQAFLARGDALHVVAAGDVVEGRYRVESLSPASIVLTYLPLSERQVLNASGNTAGSTQ